MSEEQVKRNIQLHEDDPPIAQAMRRGYDGMNIPDGEVAWQRMQSRLQGSRRTRGRWRTLRIGAAIAACSILIGLTFGGLSPTSAFMNWFAMVRKTDHGIVSVLFGSAGKADTSSAKTAPPPEFYPAESTAIPRANGNPPERGGVIQPEKVTLDQAKAKLDYALQVPDSLPDGYSLDRVDIYPDQDGVYRMADLTYMNGSEQMLDISQKKLRANSSGTSTTINQAAGTIKEVDVNGYKAILVLYTAGCSRLEWLVQGVKVEIYGKVGEDALLKLAKSMK